MLPNDVSLAKRKKLMLIAPTVVTAPLCNLSFVGVGGEGGMQVLISHTIWGCDGHKNAAGLCAYLPATAS